jgi:hypothetical protein
MGLARTTTLYRTEETLIISLSMLRKIIHIDMDAFFAAIEEREHPELHNVPMAVGHADKRGVYCHCQLCCA